MQPLPKPFRLCHHHNRPLYSIREFGESTASNEPTLWILWRKLVLERRRRCVRAVLSVDDERVTSCEGCQAVLSATLLRKEVVVLLREFGGSAGQKQPMSSRSVTEEAMDGYVLNRMQRLSSL
jgi:hypothetical protein